jgi:hypothetical protein
MAAFTPGQTQELILDASSNSLTLHSDAPSVQLLLTSGNAAALAFVRLGTGAQEATFNDYPISANAPVTLTKGVGADTIAALGNAAAAGGLLYVTVGSGG